MQRRMAMKRSVSAMVLVLAVVFSVWEKGGAAEGAGAIPKETLEASSGGHLHL
jgi:hypothetical protein